MSKKQIILFVLLIAIASGVWLLRERGPSDRPHFPHEKLTITRADGTHFLFDVEVARSMSDQAYGLMFLPSMPADAGMIFPYDPPREVAFWMKNTIIPLDMLFVGADHTIGHIVTNAAPGDVTPIDSQIPVAAVIEINGGTVQADGLAVGDKIESLALPAPAP